MRSEGKNTLLNLFLIELKPRDKSPSIWDKTLCYSRKPSGDSLLRFYCPSELRGRWLSEGKIPSPLPCRYRRGRAAAASAHVQVFQGSLNESYTAASKKSYKAATAKGACTYDVPYKEMTVQVLQMVCKYF